MYLLLRKMIAKQVLFSPQMQRLVKFNNSQSHQARWAKVTIHQYITRKPITTHKRATVLILQTV